MSSKPPPPPAQADKVPAEATRDGVTGLADRHHLDLVLPGLLASATQSEQALALVWLQLDGLAGVRQRYGDAAGVALLQSFGELLSKQSRAEDAACRCGDDVFCLALPGMDAHTARRKFNALLAWWRSAEFQFDAGTSNGHGFSAGIVDSFLLAGGAAEMLVAAQSCLAEATRLGRGRVLVYDAVAFDTESLDTS